jgi:hypothetical protein
MANEALIGQFFETFQLLLEPISHFFVDPRLERKQADHDHLAGSFPDGPAKKTGMTFMKNIDDPIIIDVFAAFTDFVSAGRTVRDLFGNRLVTFGAESHNFFDNIGGSRG